MALLLLAVTKLLLALVPTGELPPALSPYEILKLVGFATGAALHLYLCWMILSRYGIRQVERTLLGLGLSIGFWHLGNFATVIYEMLDVAGIEAWRKVSDSVAYVALAFLPPLLAHAHLRIWSLFDERAPRKLFKPFAVLGYVPLVSLPWVVAKLWQGDYAPPMEKLSLLLLPFILWIVAIFGECALIDWRLSRLWQSARERRFFEVFGGTLAAIGVLFLLTYVFGARQLRGLGQYFDLIAKLSSLAPTAIVAYYIYRYRYLELVIRQSFVYAVLAVAVMMVYLYGIRRLGIFLSARYDLRADVFEALLILLVLFLSGPLRRVVEHYLQKLFAREVGLYRDLVAQVGAAASSYGELAHFVEFAERRLREALTLEEIKIIPRSQANAAQEEACRAAEAGQLTELEQMPLLEPLDALACYALWREGRVVGLLLVRGNPQLLTSEKREVLTVVAGHIAVAVENCQLLEEKVKLERELAERERLASLGQMAATVAHEVKNPLSAIKSITQVMREDEEVRREYGRDLDLVIGEVDRLSRSVSQLLSFSRPAAVAGAPAGLSEIIAGVLALTRAEAEPRLVKITVDLQADSKFDGERAAALKEVLLNLTLNAIQAIPLEGEVRIESASNGDGQLKLTVIDSGAGIPPEVQDKIFEPFFTTKQRGTGLGLAIVARRVRELAGEIKVANIAEGKNETRFDILIPSSAFSDNNT
ncbi:MAG TPA: ATP-binding protein [Blastocatellia bacterium]|nr:ATP-binding protein [Blastocatellia bacterium]HMV86385.1 ATP-binding protein [Blastocatellia bacterium]HMY75262.1 ATP-binding protein [Blastocatellia bacterium]HMZ22208.1 ATP-binding protein [Blastocatellia bacterium]HNG33317.1 ATP-binding protein [Blastocatellia bacterium]